MAQRGRVRVDTDATGFNAELLFGIVLCCLGQLAVSQDRRRRNRNVLVASGLLYLAAYGVCGFDSLPRTRYVSADGLGRMCFESNPDISATDTEVSRLNDLAANRSTTNVRARRNSGGGMLWLIIFLAATAAILSYRAFESRVDSRLRGLVYERLAALFPKTRIRIDRVTIEGPTKIVVHGLRMAVKDGAKARQVMKIDRVVLTGDLDIAHCVQETVQVHRVDLYRPQATLWQTESGSWSVEALMCKRTPGQETPELIVHEGELRIYRELRENAVPIVFLDVSGRIAQGDFVPDTAVVSGLPTRLISGRLQARSSGLCEAVEIDGWLNPAIGRWQLEGTMRDLVFSTDLAAKLPVSLARSLTQVAGLSCKASARFMLGRTDSSSGWEFRVRGKLGYGRLNDARLPYPLEKLSGDFFCDNKSLQLRDIKAESGEASFSLDADINGFHPQAPVVLVAEATMLQLDGRVYKALPEKWQKYWDRIRPDGYVDGKVYLSSDGQRWRPSLLLNCRDVQLECWLFPYPLSKVKGQVIIESERLVGTNLRGEAGGQPINGGFNFHLENEEWFGKLKLKGDGPVAIDEKVLTALTPRHHATTSTERFVRDLEPSGTFQIKNAVFERRTKEADYWHKSLDIQVNDCAVLYKGFRYPLHRIRGRILATDDHWSLENFEGWNDSGRIQCNGEWIDGQVAGVPFRLNFTAHSLAMEDELQQALPADARQLWEQIRPSGSLDRADVRIVRPSGTSQVDIQVDLHEDKHSNATTGQSLRLHPASFPYWLSDVACDLTYRPGFVKINQASANNGNSRVSLYAECQQNAAGNWVGSVDWLPTSRVMVDTQLLRALPEAISSGLLELDLRGPVNVMGRTKFELPSNSSQALTTDIKLQLDLEDVQVGEGKVIDGVRGTVLLVGRRDNVQMVAVGLATIDAVSLRGIPVTNIRGPLALVGNQLYFGSEVTGHFEAEMGKELLYGPEFAQHFNATAALLASDVTAEALSGTLSMSGSGQLDSGRFQIKSKLADADLRCMLQDLGASQAPTDARCQAELVLSGVPWETQTYSGAGSIHLSNAQLYQLPTMIQLMRKLSVTPTAKTAFHTADINFEVDGDRIPLKLACEGDLLSLRGSGWTNFRRELDLELYSYVGGRVPVSSVLNPLISDSRYATFMSLEVDGTLDNPRIERRAFPQLAVLQQIFPDKVPSEEEPSRFLGRLRRAPDEVPRTADTRSAAQ